MKVDQIESKQKFMGQIPVAQQAIPKSGWGLGQVPEMPAYITGYSKRGNGFQNKATPTFSQPRVPNRRFNGNIPTVLTHLQQRGVGQDWKSTNRGIHENYRWNRDARPNIGALSTVSPALGAIYTGNGSKKQHAFRDPTIHLKFSKSINRPHTGFAGIYIPKRRQALVVNEANFDKFAHRFSNPHFAHNEQSLINARMMVE
jgi:hypothetical protein